MHESRCHEFNCFVTLTFADEHLPDVSVPWYPVFQKFMKRLRRRFSGVTIRFFCVGEYGEQFSRPHFHACLFGVDFPRDRVHSRRGDYVLYESDLLNSLWPFGHASFGTMTAQSAGYCARYSLKKVTGAMAESHYTFIDRDTGEVRRARIVQRRFWRVWRGFFGLQVSRGPLLILDL